MPNPFRTKTATTVLDLSDSDGVRTAVRFYQTNVVEFTPDFVRLDSGGWETVTTKRRMNEVSDLFDLGFGVFQKNFEWFVVLPSGKTVPFVDGITFPRLGKKLPLSLLANRLAESCTL